MLNIIEITLSAKMSPTNTLNVMKVIDKNYVCRFCFLIELKNHILVVSYLVNHKLMVNH